MGIKASISLSTGCCGGLFPGCSYIRLKDILVGWRVCMSMKRLWIRIHSEYAPGIGNVDQCSRRPWFWKMIRHRKGAAFFFFFGSGGEWGWVWESRRVLIFSSACWMVTMMWDVEKGERVGEEDCWEYQWKIKVKSEKSKEEGRKRTNERNEKETEIEMLK